MAEFTEDHSLQKAAAPQVANDSRLARWIDDPFASVILGIVAPTAAVSVLVGAIAGLGLIH